MSSSMLDLPRRLHSRLRETGHLYMVLLAVLVGLAGGLCAVGFREFIDLVQRIAWQSDSFTLEHVRALPSAWKILTPAIGGLVVGLIIYFFAPEAKGHGVPEVMEAVALRGGRIRPRVVLAKLAASGICIGTGGSVGREGPIVQIGSALGSSIGQWLHLGEQRLRTLVACGAAAGIAGTFNAPVAGALFAGEVILGNFGVEAFSVVIISSVAGTVVSRHFLGDVPAFDVPDYSLVNPSELLAYAALGVLAGLVALVFVRALYATEDVFDKVSLPGPLKALAGGALIGLIGLRYPEVFGVGYEAIEQALHAQLAWKLLLALTAVKILAVSVTIGSGGSGGIFAPSLFIGAMLGGSVGMAVQGVWPTATAGPGAYALVGMGAIVAAATHAPITAILILFELTGDYQIILPLMIACILATLLARRLEKGSIYTLKLLRRGVDILAGQTVNVLRHLKVRDVMRRETITVSHGEQLMPVVSLFVENPGEAVFVTGEDRSLQGLITINEIRPIMSDFASMQSLIIAGDMMRAEDFPILTPDESLDGVMRRFGSYRFQAPVVEEGRLVGAVWPQDVIQRYNSEVVKRDMASSMSAGSVHHTYAMPGVQGLSMVEIPVPASFVGYSLATVDTRSRFNASVLLVKHRSGIRPEMDSRVPEPDYIFRYGDVILAMGAEEGLRRLERTA